MTRQRKREELEIRLLLAVVSTVMMRPVEQQRLVLVKRS